MNFFKKLLSLINRVYRLDEFVNMLLSPIGNYFNRIYTLVTSIRDNFFFDSLDEDGCKYYEKLLAITPEIDDSIENRRAKIQAKWLSNNHNSIILIQNICNSWDDGNVDADFIKGKIQLKFKKIGIPKNLESLLKAINIVRPAHIPILPIFRYLLVEDIHMAKTVEQMEELTIDMFEN